MVAPVINPDEFFRENLVHSRIAAQRARERLRYMQEGTVGYSTKLLALDEFVRLMPGQLTTVAGRSGCGKTAFGMQVVYQVLSQIEERGDLGVICIFSAEMDGESLMLREACAIEKISYWRVQTGDCSTAEYDKLDERLANMGSRRVYIDESPAPTLEHMIEQLKALTDEGQSIAMVLFDYTELAGEYDRDESKRVNKISRGLAAIAKRFACPVLTLSQLNRDIEARSDKTPSMRDLMHGGERDAACIVILVRPWSYDKASPRELVNCHVVKNRFGKQGDTTLGFDEISLRFYSAKVAQKELNAPEYLWNGADK